MSKIGASPTVKSSDMQAYKQALVKKSATVLRKSRTIQRRKSLLVFLPEVERNEEVSKLTDQLSDILGEEIGE
jgi:hypothetical protein